MKCLQCQSEMKCVNDVNDISTRIDWLKCPVCGSTGTIIYNGGMGPDRNKVVHSEWTTNPYAWEAEKCINNVLKMHGAAPSLDESGKIKCSQYMCLYNSGIKGDIKGYCALMGPEITISSENTWECRFETYIDSFLKDTSLISKLYPETQAYIMSYNQFKGRE